ncbi:DUF6261 family protein [Bacteroides pyogenes]|uniref:DUF6261 family protein n=1 Tax=Bacteroides pyogenes TaxID=310300 RepID=UPI0003DD12D7|nr:DUF6261 family protein [Bacteroides pyogenes]MBB3894979.1 hypothetical protein [Bacteroides pyogenes]GAE22613.1 hypothetical protein JCM10003_2247 [Bacteroides pyogenes JCM 10003]SUV33315.1 Uncharacterised protein [Bacteroides pyogenes]
MGNEDFNLAKLSMNELAELVEQHLQAIDTCEPPLDLSAFPIIEKYLKTLRTRAGELKEALAAIPKDSVSESILLADRARDKALSVFRRKMQMFELTTDPNEEAAYKQLNEMWSKYETLAYMNFQVETEGINELVFNLTTSRFSSQVATLNLEPEVEQMRTDNENFKRVFGQDPERSEAKISYDARELYHTLIENYKRYREYLHTSLEAHNELVVKRIVGLL